MTTTEQSIERMKRTINLMSRIAGNMAGTDFEDVEAMNRAISNLSTELFELELSLQPATDNLAVAA